MAQKKTKYDLLLKSLEIPKNMYYDDWDWGYYDFYFDDDYYSDVEYSYLKDDFIQPVLIVRKKGLMITGIERELPYKKIDMESFYSIDYLRNKKIDEILNGEKVNKLTFYDIYKYNNKKIND